MRLELILKSQRRWDDAIAGGTAGFRAFHDKYAPANELGCTIGQTL